MEELKKQTHMSAENKVKEYIGRAKEIDPVLFSSIGSTEADIRKVLLAQMIQREEHFNKTKDKK